jgi:hypothetical protein
MAEGFLDPAVEVRRETLGRAGAFGQDARGLRSGNIAGYLEGQDDRLGVFQAKLLFEDAPDFVYIMAGPGRDFARYRLRVELLTDGDAAPHATLPPPLGRDTGEVLLHEYRSLIGEELI